MLHCLTRHNLCRTDRASSPRGWKIPTCLLELMPSLLRRGRICISIHFPPKLRISSIVWTPANVHVDVALRLTLPKTNIDPDNGPNGRRFFSTNQGFSGSMLVFQGVDKSTEPCETDKGTRGSNSMNHRTTCTTSQRDDPTSAVPGRLGKDLDQCGSVPNSEVLVFRSAPS